MLFSKSKNESDPEDRTLFDMRRIGKRISELRRSKDITQTALADMMGISFQAVSNWERGESMPDISKLGDLSRIFGVSIDEILCNPRAAKIVEEISAGEKPDDMTAEELAETAPIMTPTQAQENVEGNLDKITLAQLAELAPFVSSESLAVIAHKCVDNGCSAKELVAIAPFMDEDDLGKIVFEMSDSKWTVADFALLYPFIDEDTTGKILSEKLGKKYSLIDFAESFDGDEVHRIINNVKNSMK
ncbi:putative uncharacterized protein [Candidatus Colimorpha enterica]|uniref:HTH cro/C1-type domain-containing protein n=1 Tax=Candidatus Colimorpha enterica TaxID=3083063 RepID=R6U040_9BACT|nr:putative uncharacterized protein [Candidatus Colimorpha enterica]